MSTFTPDTSNTLFQLAADLVNQSNRSLFLTGKAGTGKTTFLKYIRENCAKQMAVLAPTGVAAINAGGVTIHSFFQLPFSPFLPTSTGTGFSAAENQPVNRHNLISRLRFNDEKRKTLRQLELLVIDEISMVRCDLLDAMDMILRHFRRRPYERFGGLQLLFIGDMFQLPPVVKDAEWSLLQEHYDSPYFFSSHVLKEEPPLYIEFDKIYRQSEEQFINVLNQVRNNRLEQDGLALLDSRFQPELQRSKDDGYIVLTTHNEQAKNINTLALKKLEEKAIIYKAEVEKDFPPSAYPAEENLHLKTGAQVMFIKNDSAEKGKRYFNGKIGWVTALEEDKITVQCKDEADEIEVEREQWQNIRYSVDKTAQSIQEEVLGSFSQFPLRLAWAITIHKSQGLTFEKAIIDAGEAFAPGQVYVALSRCTSLDGLVLKSRIRPGRLFTDQRIVQFSQQLSSSARLKQELEEARRHYQLQLLLDVFDFRNPLAGCAELKQYIAEHKTSFNTETIHWLDELTGHLQAADEVAQKFHNWLKAAFAKPDSPEENKALQERCAKAAVHFTTAINNTLILLQQSPAITDSKLHAKEYNEQLKDIFVQLSFTKHLLSGFDGNLQPAEWLQRKKKFITPFLAVNAYAGASQKQTSSPHPVLHKQLKELRDSLCSQKNLPVYLVAGSNTLDEMARYLPQTTEELGKISGFGEVKLKQYGPAFLEIIVAYCTEKKLPSLIHEKEPKRERATKTGATRKKGDTHAETLRLYKEGNNISAIAEQRALTTSTIEGHLSKFIRSGEISIHEIVSSEKFILVESLVKETPDISFTTLKQKLPSEISYGEIRMVMAGIEFLSGEKKEG
mgnify:CR=1 FL=1